MQRYTGPAHYPSGPFIFLLPQNQEIGKYYVVQKRQATDLEARKLWKGLSGHYYYLPTSASGDDIRLLCLK